MVVCSTRLVGPPRPSPSRCSQQCPLSITTCCAALNYCISCSSDLVCHLTSALCNYSLSPLVQIRTMRAIASSDINMPQVWGGTISGFVVRSTVTTAVGGNNNHPNQSATWFMAAIHRSLFLGIHFGCALLAPRRLASPILLFLRCVYMT